MAKSIVINSLLVFLIAFLFISCNNRKVLSESEKLGLFGKSWGLMKYHHPNIGLDKVNWDSVFIEHVFSIKSTKSNKEFYEELSKILKIPKNEFVLKKSNECDADKTEKLVDFKWIDSDNLSKENKQLLMSILNLKVSYANKYVSNAAGASSLDYAKFYENPLENADLSKVEIRLLGLFRYWNIVEYYFPYKNITDKNWEDVISEYIPQFINAKDKEEYYECLLRLSTEINDGHASIPYHPELRRSFFGKMTVPFSAKFIENQLVINTIKSDSLSRISNIIIGDIILSIDDEPVNIKSQKLGKYLPKPNKAYHDGEISRYILNGNTDSVKLFIKRNNDSIELKIQRYLFSDIRKYRDKNAIKAWEILEGNVGYANIGELNSTNLLDFFSDIKNTDGLILDFRYYPNWEILHDFLSHFYKEVKPFLLSKSQCLENPGSYYWHFSENDTNNIKPNGFEYNKEVKILVDENTLSLGEFFVMAMQMLDNVEVVGSQTAGEDGNQVGIDMPGGIKMFMSSLGVYYPNGDRSQRTGVKIDKLINQKIDDLKHGTDRSLNYSLKMLSEDLYNVEQKQPESNDLFK